jgi:hypothetical protein
LNQIFTFIFIQVFYGLGFYGGTGPYINVSFNNPGYGPGAFPWASQTAVNLTGFANAVPLNPYLGISLQIEILCKFFIL